MFLICQGACKFTMFPILRFGLHIYAVRESDLQTQFRSVQKALAALWNKCLRLRPPSMISHQACRQTARDTVKSGPKHRYKTMVKDISRQLIYPPYTPDKRHIDILTHATQRCNLFRVSPRYWPQCPTPKAAISAYHILPTTK
jgi:hypothetical protein